MSEHLLRDEFHPIETKSGAAVRVGRLFLEIEKIHGAEEARRLFGIWGKKPSKNRINELKNWNLLERFDAMKEQNVAELARQIVEENLALPKDQQLTPRFRPTLPTVDKHLRNLLTQRENAMRQGAWDGPGRKWPDSGGIVTK